MTAKTDSVGGFDDGRLPVCEQLLPRLKENGQDWLIELARCYESGWNLALAGAPRPSADSVLQLIAPERQQDVRSVLESIDTRYALVASDRTPSGSDLDPWCTLPLPEPWAIPPNAPPPPQADTAGQSNETVSLTQDEKQSTEAADVPSSAQASLDMTVESSAPSELPPAHTHATDDASFEQTVSKPAIHPGLGNNRAHPLSGLPVIPGYQIKGILGRGGMGIVYLAHQQGIDRPVALKMILARSYRPGGTRPLLCRSTGDRTVPARKHRADL